MAKTTMVCVKEVYQPPYTIEMVSAEAISGHEVARTVIQDEGYRIPVGQTFTASNQSEVKRLVKSGHWQIA